MRLIFEQTVVDAIHEVSKYDTNDIVNAIIGTMHLPSYNLAIVSTYEIPDVERFGGIISEIETIYDCIEVMNESRKVSSKDTRKAITLLVTTLIPQHSYSAINENSIDLTADNVKSVLADLYYYFIVKYTKGALIDQNYRDESVMSCIDLADLYTTIVYGNESYNAVKSSESHGAQFEDSWMVSEIVRLCRLIKTADEEWDCGESFIDDHKSV